MKALKNIWRAYRALLREAKREDNRAEMGIW